MAKSFTKYIIVGFASIGLLSYIVSSDAKVSTYNHAANADDYEMTTMVADAYRRREEELENLFQEFLQSALPKPSGDLSCWRI